MGTLVYRSSHLAALSEVPFEDNGTYSTHLFAQDHRVQEFQKGEEEACLWMYRGWSFGGKNQVAACDLSQAGAMMLQATPGSAQRVT